MNIREWIEQERQEWSHAQPRVRELQAEYLKVMEDLIVIIEVLDFPIESIIIREE